MRVFTIGHSNQALAPFLDALAAHRIALVADVRRYPTSRRHPHFSRSTLATALTSCGAGYLHLPELGGHRQPRPDSRNSAVHAEAFRGYADHMDSDEFAGGIARLLQAAAAGPVAIMCAERLWENCHRGYIADYLKSQGHDVIHILGPEKTEPHPYTAAARIIDGQLSYQGLL